MLSRRPARRRAGSRRLVGRATKLLIIGESRGNIMNHGLWKSTLAAFIIIVAATANGMLLRSSGRSDNTPEFSKADEQASKADQTSKTSETPRASDSAKARAILETATASKSSEQPKTAEERRQLLETVGTLTAAHC